MSKLLQAAIISGVVVILSLIAAWILGGSEELPPPPMPPAPQAARTFPRRVTTAPLTAPKPPPPDVTASGLAWLAKAQHPDGHWDLAPDRTGLALLAFLSAGETHRHGRYKRTVRNGLKFLKRIQQPNGFYVVPDGAPSNRDHAIATLAMVEAYALTPFPLFRQSAQQAVDVLMKLDGLDDEATAWACLALGEAAETRPRLRVDGAKRDMTGIRQHRSACRSPSGCYLCRAWHPASTLDPLSQYFGSWRGYVDGFGISGNWRRDLRELAASLQQEDGSFDPAGPRAASLGRTGSTALMIAATAMTFWPKAPHPR